MKTKKNENGFGVRKDCKKAIEMYGKAVENGEKAGLDGIKNVYLKIGKDKSKLLLRLLKRQDFAKWHNN